MKIKNLLQKMQRGSILAYSLIIMTAMLTIAIGLSIVTVSGKKNATDTQSSVQSFQYASEGSQFVTKKIASSTDEDELIENIFSDCDIEDGLAYIKGSDERYKVFLYSNENGTEKITGCNKKIVDIKSIKSVGSYKNTSRAVQVALAASTGDSFEYTCDAMIGGEHNGDFFCCRIDKNNGEVVCKRRTQNNGSNWTYVATPFSSGETSRYDLSCTFGDGGSPLYLDRVFCCRADIDNNLVSCAKSNNSSGSIWTVFSGTNNF